MMSPGYMTRAATAAAIAFVLLPMVTTYCLFPNYVQTNPLSGAYWRHAIHNQGRQEMGFYHNQVVFEGNVMTSEVKAGPVFGALKRKSFVCQCIMNVDDLYLVSRETTNGDTSDMDIAFMCIKFQRMSPSVVNMYYSVNTSLDFLFELCTGEFVADYWPMVYTDRPYAAGQHFSDSHVGGYDFTVKTSTHSAICGNDASDPLPHMEVGCDPDGELTIDWNSCTVPGLMMSGVTTLTSLGHWDADGVHFFVLHQPGTKHVWCLRMAPDIIGHSAYLFLDVVCDPTPDVLNGTNYIILDFAQSDHSQLCQDASPQYCAELLAANDNSCSLFNEADIQQCRLSCQVCTHMANIPDESGCVFPPSLLGVWHRAAHNNDRPVLIYPSNMVFIGSEKLTCMNSQLSNHLRYPLKYAPQNGCFPRFTCIEFHLYSDLVISYRLATSALMPRDMNHIEDVTDICIDSRFPIDSYGEPKFKNLIFEPIRFPLADHTDRFVDCGLHERGSSVFKYSHTLKTGIQCKGQFSAPCDNPKEIPIEPLERTDEDLIEQVEDPCTGLWLSPSYLCLATFRNAQNDRYTILQGEANATSPYGTNKDEACWVFPSSSPSLMYVLPSAECHEDTASKIRDHQIQNVVLYGFQGEAATGCGVSNTQAQADTPASTTTTTDAKSTSTQYPFNGDEAPTLNAQRLQSHNCLVISVILAALYFIDTLHYRVVRLF